MKTAVVTGASGGIGQAVAKHLLDEGWRVFALDIQSQGGQSPLASQRGLSPLAFQTDLTDEESVRSAFSKVCEETKVIDAIIHMAGIYDLNSLVEMSEADFVRIFNINLFSIFRVNKIFFPLLKKGSRIVMTSSELAPLDPLPFTGIYGITKSAVEKYAYSLRMEMQLLGIDVVVIRPGAVDTGLLNVSTSRLDDFVSGTKLYSCNSERFRAIVDRVETRKVAPEKIADLVLRAVNAKHPAFVYSINRNPLLLLMHLLPKRLQTRLIKIILSDK